MTEGNHEKNPNQFGNLCFRARQHLRSLSPIINDFLWLWWPIIFGDGCSLSFPDICLTVEEKPRKNPQPRKLTRPWIEPAPARWEAMMLPLNHSGGPVSLVSTGIRTLNTPNTSAVWWISIGAMLCAFKNFIADCTSQSAGAEIRASNFNRCNNVTVRAREVPLMHASCDVITLSYTYSHFMQYMVY